MTDRPILFSAPMVRALLDGRKTQTRRVLKPQPIGPLKGGEHLQGLPGMYVVGDTIWPIGPGYSIVSNRPGPHPRWIEEHVRVKIGDRLWVREAWQTGMSSDGPQISYRATPDYCPIEAWDGPDEGIGPSFNYDRCPSARFDHWLGDVLLNDGPWRPGIHMPRWASRLTLIVTGVRVQRVQEITYTDVEAEGIAPPRADDFVTLWDGLNAPRGYSWEANPWVIAVSFEVQKQNIDQAKSGRDERG